MEYPDYNKQTNSPTKGSANQPLKKKIWDTKKEEELARLEGLSYRARRMRIRFQRFIRMVITASYLVFFIVLFLSLSIFGSDKYYTLKQNENLEKVAAKFKVPVKIIMNLNDLDNNDSLSPGDRIKIPTEHDVHIVSKNETLYSIAKKNGITYHELAQYNKLTNNMLLTPGERIYIPRMLSKITIASDQETGLVPFEVQFSISTNTRDKVKKFIWDMGDGQIIYDKNPNYTYKEKGDYSVRLKVVDENNNEIQSNTIRLNVRRLANIQFTRREYFTANKGDIISLDAQAIDNLGQQVAFDYKCKISGTRSIIKQVKNTDKFEVINTGYAKVTIETQGYTHTGFYFISPISSVHSDREDMYWYKTQYGVSFKGNCGPSSTAMAIGWALGIDVNVNEIRSYIGRPYPDGAVDFGHIISSINQYGIENKTVYLKSSEEVFDFIDQDKILIVSYDRGNIEVAKGNPVYDLFGRHYNDSGGHYSIIKGYSKDKRYFIVHDPMPHDWWLNSARYPDGISHLGRNRYYSVNNMFRTMYKMAIVISRKTPGP
ncbi:MAG: LysM peptidoglycan-binding domain-containing protein [Spirochaetales bacterium]|nr:LysM peptidoglycan-binding domain-containing protein [Spirochaetales bacterium]